MSAQWSFMKFAADPEKCHEELLQICDENGGAKPEEIVDFARDENTELHKCFQWDDSIAAENWRKQQARMITASLKVTVETQEHGAQSFRIFQHVEDTYKPVTLIVRNEDEYAELLNKAKADLIAFKKRYKSLTELQELIEEIDRII